MFRNKLAMLNDTGSLETIDVFPGITVPAGGATNETWIGGTFVGDFTLGGLLGNVVSTFTCAFATSAAKWLTATARQ